MLHSNEFVHYQGMSKCVNARLLAGNLGRLMHPHEAVVWLCYDNLSPITITFLMLYSNEFFHL